MSYEVKILKLVTGEEVLAKVEEARDGGQLLLSDSRTLGYQQDGRPGMMPFVQMAPDRTVTLEKSAVIATVFPVDPKMEKKYIEDTSGLVMP